MQTIAKLKYLRVAPRKVRLVVDLIRGLTVINAEKQLKFLTKRSVFPIEKLLKSAVANAENNAKLIKDNLYISKIAVDEGPTLKRWRARAMGRAAEIMKRTSHITLVLDEVSPGVFKKSEKRAKKNVEKNIRKDGDKEKQKTKQIKSPYLESDKNILSKQNIKGNKKIFRRKSI